MSAEVTWDEMNRGRLLAEIDVVRGYLRRHIERQEADAQPTLEDSTDVDRTESDTGGQGSALDALCSYFGLSRFERLTLLLCAGVELEGDLSTLCGQAQGDSGALQPTFSLALAAFPSAQWEAISPGAALRYWKMIEVAPGGSLTQGPLRIDERILHYLAGVQFQDERLSGLLTSVWPDESMAQSHERIAERIAGVWSQSLADGEHPVFQLCGGESVPKRLIAARACALLGFGLSVLPEHLLPSDATEMEAFRRLWQREALLYPSALMMDCRNDARSGWDRIPVGDLFIERMSGLLILSTDRPRDVSSRLTITLDVSHPPLPEQREIWAGVLGPAAAGLSSTIDRMIFQFNLSAPAIRAVYADTASRLPEDAEADDQFASTLWECCRDQARPSLDELVQRIRPVATWDDLVLPERQEQTLRDITAQVRHRATVYGDWGFSTKSNRGLGISALFAGPSGTGKTLAAEVVAADLKLDLFHIDLSSVVNKYIGETEKNIRRIFDAAEAGGAILLFDEADALFGKRSEVKDSHDRYANIEVSYLLQRLEAYRGLAILTSNLKEALDPAFQRRLRFVVHFPFPDVSQRENIWSRVFPSDTPVDRLDFKKLAQLNVTGGNIRSIALNAAFQAAEQGTSVDMAVIKKAAQSEYTKLEKTLTDAETRGWV